MNPKVDDYMLDGCGRCPLGGTPDCKVHRWYDVLQELRRILLDCMLVEERKWGVPCYTYDGKNVLIMSAFKEYCSLSFFKGSLLSDSNGILIKPGENSQASRQLRFTNAQQVLDIEADIKAYVFEAVEIEKAGLKPKYKSTEEYPVPDELEEYFNTLPELETAFYRLTPGRQRGYLLHFSSAKQSKTRLSRIEKCMSAIMSGKGLNDR